MSNILLPILQLLLAHILVDFVLQPTSWIKDKKEKLWLSPYLYIHSILAGVLSLLLTTNSLPYWVYIVIIISHGMIDIAKLYLNKKYSNHRQQLLWFVLDQAAHILVLLVLWCLSCLSYDWLIHIISPLHNTKLYIIVLAYLIILFPAGVFIELVMCRWHIQLPQNITLPGAGKWIGITERLLVLTFVLSNHFEAIGLLIAAKSILRVSTKTKLIGSLILKSNDRPNEEQELQQTQSEYILIGTLLSFAIAVLTGIAANYIIHYKAVIL